MFEDNIDTGWVGINGFFDFVLIFLDLIDKIK